MIDFNGKDRRIQDVEKIKESGLPIYIYGGGVYGKSIALYLRKHGVGRKIEFVVDDDFVDEDDKFVPFSEFLRRYAHNSVMIFGIYNYEMFLEKKRLYGDKIKFYDFHFTCMGDNPLSWSKVDAENNIEAYKKTWNLLHDDFSRLTMELYLRAAVNGEFYDLYKKCHVNVAYFNDLTKNIDVGTLVDCGAYDGDSIHDFVNMFWCYVKI